MEYVRICDVYGAGFYYIPGTETCLKIGGLVRYQIDWDNAKDNPTTAADEGENGWRKTTAARLRVDARSETEYGTFKRFIELHLQNNGGEFGTASATGYCPYTDTTDMWIRYAYFELGGLMVCRNDTLFDGNLDGEFDKGGGTFINQVRYSFDAGNGIAVSVGLEEDNNYDYIPLITGKVSISQGWGSLNLYAAYDDRFEEFALKALANIKATDALMIQAIATYESGATWLGLLAPYSGYDWSLGGYLKYAVNKKLSIGAGGQYFGGRHVGNFTTGQTVDLNADDWAIGAVIDYKIVENLSAKLALNYNDGDSYKATIANPANDGVFSGFLRLDASF